jgi:hypothetical protein
LCSFFWILVFSFGLEFRSFCWRITSTYWRILMTSNAWQLRQPSQPAASFRIFQASKRLIEQTPPLFADNICRYSMFGQHKTSLGDTVRIPLSLHEHNRKYCGSMCTCWGNTCFDQIPNNCLPKIARTNAAARSPITLP